MFLQLKLPTDSIKLKEPQFNLYLQKYHLENKIQNKIFERLNIFDKKYLTPYFEWDKKNFLNKLLTLINTDMEGIYLDYDVFIFNEKKLNNLKNKNFICKYSNYRYDWEKMLKQSNLKIHKDILNINSRYRGVLFNVNKDFKNNCKKIFLKYLDFYKNDLYKYSWIFEELILSECFEKMNNSIFININVNAYNYISVMHYDTNFLLKLSIEKKWIDIIKLIKELNIIYKKIKKG